MEKERIVLIRADGGVEIGMGHLVRTSVLAKELSKYIKVIYICSEQYVEGIKWLKDRGYEVIAFNKKELTDSICEVDAEAIITDHYEIDSYYIKQVRKHFSVVVYLDDNILHEYQANIIVNQNFAAENLPYSKKLDTMYLLGSRHLLVRDEFREETVNCINKCVENIMVTVGGSDYYNYTDQLLEMIRNLPYIFHVIIGSAFPHERSILEKYQKNKNIKFYIQPNMKDIMQISDLAISSCGSTLYELGVLGIPTIGISVAENQEQMAIRMHKEKMINYLGKMDNLEKKQLIERINYLADSYSMRKSMADRCREKLNKDGVRNVVKLILSLI